MQIRTGTARITGGGTDGDDLDIHYEDMGEEAAPPVLLIMGLGAQLLLWRTGFCERLVNRGFRVIRYDNRDVGLSGKLHGRRAEGPLIPALARSFIGRPSPSVYTLEHMAEDAAALLDHLRIDRAHIVGASMGGMIAQIFAARYPQRTAGLGILISSNNAALLPPPAPRALLALIKGPAPDPPGKSSSRTQCGCPRSSAARAFRPRNTRCGPRRSKATTAPTTHRASPGTSVQCWAVAASNATTGRSPRRRW